MLSSRKEQSVKHTTWLNFQLIILTGKSYLFCDPNCLSLSEGQCFRNEEQISGCQKLEMKWGGWLCLWNSNRRDLCGDGLILCLDCISASILVVISNYSFARWYHWGKLGKE